MVQLFNNEEEYNINKGSADNLDAEIEEQEEIIEPEEIEAEPEKEIIIEKKIEEIKKSPFVHLHVHSEFSCLDGAIKMDDLCKKALSLGMPSIAITDHGVMYGAIQFYKTLNKYGLKPIIGIEIYVSPTTRFDKQMTERQSSNHIVLLAQNYEGYLNLIKIASIAFVEGFYYKPRIDFETLEKYSSNIICLTGCLKGFVSEALVDNKPKLAEHYLNKLINIFGKERLFLEMMDHGMQEQKIVNAGLIDLSKKFDVRLVATNDCHYLNQEDSEVHDVLLCVGTQKTVNDKERLKFNSDQLYFKSYEEMLRIFGEVPEALTNTMLISDMCDLKIPFKQNLLPVFTPPAGKTQEEYLRELVYKGLQEKYKTITEEIKSRAQMELGVIHQTNYDSYFLIVWDFVNFAKSNSIPVGPGRGSAAGSIVAYALGITDIDPLQHGLIFERFLNIERISMPDIDIDFCFEKRGLVIDYVREKYGDKNVSQIITFGTMKAKNAVRDVGRALGIDKKSVDKIAKMIPDKADLKSSVKISLDLKNEMESNPQIANLLKLASKIEGHVRHPSIHAAGVVISSKQLDSILPLFKNAKDGEIATQYNMKEVDELGLLKMDFLGLKNLTIIEDAIQRIEQSENVKIDWNKISLDDPKTYELLQSADTYGVFQLESSGMRDIVKRLQPEKFDEITALLALYRPGPLGSGMHNDFIERKHGRIPIVYDHPLLEDILKETYGVILYQEQVMKIAVSLAGYTLGEADNLRKAIGKKLGPEEMANYCTPIVEKCVKRGIKKDVAQKIVDQMIYFAGYGFNKSHSAAYALLTFRTAYLKAHYPVHFMAAYLTSEMTKKEKIGFYFAVCKEMGITILPPDVNESDRDFTVVGDNIRFGLAGVQNVGKGIVDAIIQERKKNGKFKDLLDFAIRTVPIGVNTRTIEAFIKCGAFDSFKLTRASLQSACSQVVEIAQKKAKEKIAGELSLFSFFGDSSVVENSFQEIHYSNLPEWPDHIRLQNEKEMLGFYITGHPLDRFIIDIHSFPKVDTTSFINTKQNQEISLIGMITRIAKKTDKMQKQFAFVDIEDFKGKATLLLFADVFERYKKLIELDKVIWVKGRHSIRDEEHSITVEDVKTVEDVRNTEAKFLNIEIPFASVNEENLSLIKRLLQSSVGKNPVRIVIDKPGCGKAKVLLNDLYNINFQDDFFKHLLKLHFIEEVYFSKK